MDMEERKSSHEHACKVPPPASIAVESSAQEPETIPDGKQLSSSHESGASKVGPGALNPSQVECGCEDNTCVQPMAVTTKDVQVYVRRGQEMKLTSQVVVAKRISDAADKMIIKSAAKFSAKKNPRLQVGARVRLDLLALTHFRKDSKSFKKKLEAPNWSTTIYTVSSRTDATRTSPDVYQIVDSDGNPPEQENRKRQYFRYSLMQVHDEQHFEKLHGEWSKPDWTFGISMPIRNRMHTVREESKDAVESESDSDSAEKELEESSSLRMPRSNATNSAAGSPEPDARPTRPVRAVAAPKTAKGFYLDY
jgi:hypothetical protein